VTLGHRGEVRKHHISDALANNPVLPLPLAEMVPLHEHAAGRSEPALACGAGPEGLQNLLQAGLERSDGPKHATHGVLCCGHGNTAGLRP